MRTPPEFLRAVERKFNVRITFDLACTVEDAVADCGFFYPHDNALDLEWPCMPESGHAAYCNPPFAQSAAFAAKAAASPQCHTLMLVPASVGTAWFAEHVHGHALVVFIRPRLVFLKPDGTPMPQGINRDLMLLGYGWTPGLYVCEDWRTW